MRDPDVLVVGGGIVGLFCAYHLRRAGVRVALVDRGFVGGPVSCSSGNTGFVGTQGAAPLAEPAIRAQGLRRLFDPESPLYVRPRLDPGLLRWLWHFRRACDERAVAAAFGVLVELKRRSLEVVREVCAAGPLASTFTERGIVLAVRTPEAFEQARRAVPAAVAGGVPLRVLDPDELRRLEPDVEFDIAGALYNEEGAHLRVPEFLRAFGRQLTAMGVEIHEEAEVLGFEVVDGSIARVRTAGGDFRPGETVIAAGAWSTAVGRDLDLNLTLQPAKGYTVTVQTPRHSPTRPVVLTEGRVALTPLGDRLRFGGTLELAGLDRTVARRRIDGILRTVRSYLPALEPGEPVETWTGLRPCTPDSVPFIGRASRYRNLSVACGHGHIGMGLAPAGGELLARIVTGRATDEETAPFRPDRFLSRSREAYSV